MRRLTIGTAFIGWAVLAGVALAGGDPTAAWLLAAVVCATSIMTTVPSAVLIGLNDGRTQRSRVSSRRRRHGTRRRRPPPEEEASPACSPSRPSPPSRDWSGQDARPPSHQGDRSAVEADRPSAPPFGSSLRARRIGRGRARKLVVWRRSEFFFLAYYSSDAQIAYYSIAFAVVNALIRIPSTAASVFAPAAAHLYGAGSHDRIRSGFGRASRLLVLLTLPIVALTLALGPRAITLVWGEDYAPAGDVLLILAASSDHRPDHGPERVSARRHTGAFAPSSRSILQPPLWT